MTLKRVQIILILFSVWMLAIIAPTVHFAPGNWEGLEQTSAKKPVSPEMLSGAFLALASIVLAGFFSFFLWKMLKRGKRKDDDPHEIYYEPTRVPPLFYAIVIILLFAFPAGSVWWMRHPSKIVQQPEQPGPSFVLPQQSPESPATALPRGLRDHVPTKSETMDYLPAIALLGVLGWMLRRILHRRPSEEKPLPPDLISVAARAAMDLEQGEDPPETVLRCYRDMCVILGRKVAMRQEMTTREFARLLQEAGVHEKEVLKLTTLFERVRYGRHAAGPGERVEAVTLLKAIENHYGKVAKEP